MTYWDKYHKEQGNWNGVKTGCNRPVSISPIDGTTKYKDELAEIERYHGWIESRLFGTCGRYARFFETNAERKDNE